MPLFLHHLRRVLPPSVLLFDVICRCFTPLQHIHTLLSSFLRAAHRIQSTSYGSSCPFLALPPRTMHTSTVVFVSLLGLLSGTSALTFTSPTPGTALDPTQPITISWTSDASDPSTVNFIVSDANDSSLFPAQTVVQDVPSSSGSYTVPANTIKAYGTGFQIAASGDGKTVGTLNGITLGAGSNQVSTASNGQVSFVSMATAGSAAASSAGTTEAATTEAATTAVPSSNAPAAASSVTVLTGTVTSSQSTTSASISQSTSKTTGFVTSSTSRSSSGASAAATTSAADSNTANAQLRVGSELVLGAAGVLAGFVALLA